MDNDLKEIWRDCLSQIQLSISRTHFNAWFSQSKLQELTDTTAVIGAKNKIAREYFETDFSDVITEAVHKTIGKNVEIKVVVAAVERKPEDQATQTSSLFEEVEKGRENNSYQQYLQAASLLGINPKYTFENFIVGPSNRLAHAAAFAVGENPGVAYNPLFIYGDVGLGKTHLIQAIANTLLLKDPSYKISYSSSEDFLNEMVSGIKSGNPENFRKKYRQKNLLIIDDIQFIESKKGTQEELFHTFNSLYQHSRQIIIVSDRPPEDMPFLEARLRSRFEGGMVVDINKPDFETRFAILQKKAEEKGYHIGQDVLEFIAQRFDSNIRELEGILTKLGSLSMLGKETVTLKDAMNILGARVNVKKNARIKPGDIINAVCEIYSITPKELKSPVRTERIAFSRQVAMYLLRTELNLPFLEVAHILNRKDHTTVMHAVSKIEELKTSNETLEQEIEEIIKGVRG